MPSKKYLIIYGIIMIIPLIITLLVYQVIPDVVPTDFSEGVPVVYRNKSIIWLVELFIFSISLIIIVIFKLAKNRNLKRYSMLKVKSDFRVIMAFNIFLATMAIILLYTFGYYNENNPFNFMFWGRVSATILVIYGFSEMYSVNKLEKRLNSEVKYAK